MTITHSLTFPFLPWVAFNSDESEVDLLETVRGSLSLFLCWNVNTYCIWVQSHNIGDWEQERAGCREREPPLTLALVSPGIPTAFRHSALVLTPHSTCGPSSAPYCLLGDKFSDPCSNSSTLVLAVPESLGVRWGLLLPNLGSSPEVLPLVPLTGIASALLLMHCRMTTTSWQMQENFSKQISY